MPDLKMYGTDMCAQLPSSCAIWTRFRWEEILQRLHRRPVATAFRREKKAVI